MPYDQSRDPFASNAGGLPSGPARNWYPLTAADIGAKELPRYGRAIIVDMPRYRMATLVVVPLAEEDDAKTREVVFIESGERALAVRRVVSVNGSATVPAETAISIVTA